MKPKWMFFCFAVSFGFISCQFCSCNTSTDARGVSDTSTATNAGKDKKDDCQHTVAAAFMTPADLQTVLDLAPANQAGKKKAFIQFKTDDDKVFYPIMYVGFTKPYTNVSRYLKTVPNWPFVPTTPYILGNLEWKFPPGFTPDPKVQAYYIYPKMNEDEEADEEKTYVIYDPIPIPFTFQFKDSTYTLDTTFFKKLPDDKRKELIHHVITLAGIGSVNPIPPKQ